MAESGFKLFIGDLPLDITAEELQMVFQTYGQVLGVSLLPDASTGSRSAHITYAAQQAGEDAISVLNGIYKIRENAVSPIKVMWAKDAPAVAAAVAPVVSAAAYDAAAAYAAAAAAAVGAAYGTAAQVQQVQAATASPVGVAAVHTGPTFDPDGYKLFVGGLPPDCTQEELMMVFSTYGEVNKVHLMPPHQETGRVAAFVYYKTQQPADDAISVLNDKYKIRVDADQPIVVKWAQPKEWGAGGKSWGTTGTPTKMRTNEGWKLFVGGLPLDITEGEVHTVFSTYGEVSKVHVMPPNAQNKVAAFVYYSSDQAGDDAIKVLNNVYKIRVDAPEPIQVRWASDRGTKGEYSGKGGYNSWDSSGYGKSGGWDYGKGKGGQGSLGWQQGWGGGSSWNSGWSEKGGQGGWSEGKGWGKDDGKGGELSDTKLFVGNLPEDVTDEALKYVFGTYGTVQHVHIMFGRSKTGNACAFVEYTQASEAETAIATLNDKYEIKPGCGAIMVKRARSGRPRPY